ncbi:MAG: hypothetical protein JXJ04_12700 [Spirochaetales bacterium]|nr:hypothetical protein [Spirochaetales bacterium]
MKKLLLLNLLVYLFFSCTLEKEKCFIDLKIENDTPSAIEFYTQPVNSPSEECINHGIIETHKTKIFKKERMSGETYLMWYVDFVTGYIYPASEVYIAPGQDYQMTISTPSNVPTTPTPVPRANITINNNSSWNLDISIGGLSAGILDAGKSMSCIKDIGHYALLARVNTDKYWSENINLNTTGYTWNLNTNAEPYPPGNFRIWNFENNFGDQMGIDDWAETVDVTCAIAYKKFGNFSLMSNSNATGHLIKENCWTVGNSISFGAWVYIEKADSGSIYLGVNYHDAISGRSYELMIFIGGAAVTFFITEGNETVQTDALQLNVIDNVWHYVALSYNAVNNMLYGVADNEIKSVLGNAYGNPESNWTTGVGNFYIAVENWGDMDETCYVDEVVYIPNQHIDPGIFVNHYNHGMPWGEEYIP